ncbi:MAG: hypothetical protein GY845_33075 [Planctomycetes bacterium]|nr:hypothetical protein [Planctomycetota bacterium]
MRPAEDIKRLIKNLTDKTSAQMDERVLKDVLSALEESEKTSALTQPNIWRIIMKSKITKLATAAVIVTAIMLGMYALTGSFDGTSITMAQIRQAMEEIDWMQMDGWSEEERLTSWYSFASKVAIHVHSKGRILYRDFNAGKELVWNPGSEYIYESPIEEGRLEEGRQLAGGVNNVYKRLTKVFDSIEAKGDYKITRELGIYQSQEVEIWTSCRVKGKAGPTRTELFTMYIDIDKKLPIAATDVKKGADVDIQLNVEFKYPESGPADIYEAGAPRTAQIKPSPEQ